MRGTSHSAPKQRPATAQCASFSITCFARLSQYLHSLYSVCASPGFTPLSRSILGLRAHLLSSLISRVVLMCGVPCLLDTRSIRGGGLKSGPFGPSSPLLYSTRLRGIIMCTCAPLLNACLCVWHHLYSMAPILGS